MNVDQLRDDLAETPGGYDVLAFTAGGDLVAIEEVDLDQPQEHAVLLRLAAPSTSAG